MIRRKTYAMAAALLIGLLLLLPEPQLAEPDVNALDNSKVSSALRTMLDQAAPGELVTAVVKMRATADLNGIQGKRDAVFTQLRVTALQSQASLVNELNRPEFAGKVRVLRQFWIDNLVLVQATKDVMETIAQRRDVQVVFENFTMTVPPRPEATMPGGPQGSSMQTQSQLWDSIRKIGAKQVWTTYGFNGAGVRVGGLDTGVDISHPDIAGKMITLNPADPTYPGGWAEFDANGNIISGSVPHDSDEHGTHTSGTMIGGNASGYDIGVAPGANLMHGLVIPGGSGSFTQVAGGMEWIIDPDNNPATDDGAQVVNMSLGATGTYPAMVAPTDNMVAAGVFPSFSIGNSGPSANTTGSPGNVPSACGVGATDSSDVIASFSSRGPVTWDSPPYVGTYVKPDMSAPGVKIYSSIPGGSWQWTSSLGDWSGTSMAAPHLSGTVALMLQANPSLTVAAINQLLAQTAIDLGDAGKDNTYGYGRVNAFTVVTAALAGVGTLSGTVTSSAGGPVEHAKVLVTDTGQQVYTDALGNYTMQLVAGDHTVEYTAFGYGSQTVTVAVVADETTTQDVVLLQLPSGVIAGTVTDASTGMGVAVNIDVVFGGTVVKTGSSDPTTGAFGITVPVGVYNLVFKPPFPYPMTDRNGVIVSEGVTTTVDVALMPAQILIVDDDAGAGYQTYFEQAVIAAGRSYLTVSTPPTAADMAMFEAVVWLTGNDYGSTLTAADEAALAAYLDGGGRVFISGQDIGYDIRTDAFYADYLHATYVQDDVGLGAVLGVPASAVGVGFAFDIQGGSGANNQAYPSEIDVISPAQAAFAYNPEVSGAAATANQVVKGGPEGDAITSSGGAALTFDNGTYRLVYFAFGFEAIADAATRAAVMGRVLDWLQGYPEIAHTPLGDTEDTEHPYVVTAYITSDYFPLDPSTFAVLYDVGSGYLSVPMSATGTPDEYVGYIPPQPSETAVHYYISASDVEGHTTTNPMGAPTFTHTFNVAKDVAPPVVTHVKYANTNDLEGPYRIAAAAWDNIGVQCMYLIYWKNDQIPHHRAKMELQPDGSYVAWIPGPSVVGDVYNYYLYAMDTSYSGNVTRVPDAGYYHFEIVEEFVWDFELDDGGFVQTGDVWEWGAPTTGPGAAHSGANLWATILAGDYPNSANATLDVPQITLAVSKPYSLLSFWHWYNMETNYDGGNVKISTDGGATFQVITPVGGYDGTARTTNLGIPGEPCFTNLSNGWLEEMFDLSAYAGQSITLRFHFGSDTSVYRAGWYVDDVRLRSSDVDDAAPTISNVVVPASTFDTVGPYPASAVVSDLFSGVATVSLYYTTNGGTSWVEVPMAVGATPGKYEGAIPGLPNGTRVELYVKATDVAGNETFSPAGAPANTYAFSILPSAPILVMVSSTTGATVEEFRAALEANGHTADYWNMSTQGTAVLNYLQLYENVVLDELSSIATDEQTAYAAFLQSGTRASKKGFFILGRDLSYYSGTRPFIQQYMRADYVQDNPAWYELTGEPGEPIGAGETFVISGSYPDEVQRSATYPGGEIVYRYTGPGTAVDRAEIKGEYEKEGKEWDGVIAYAPGSLDAAAGMKYNAETYRSVYFTFNFDYVQETWRQAGIIHRVLGWLESPEIVHTPLTDTEDTLSAFTVTASVYSSSLDPSRVNLVYDVGVGPVTVLMAPTVNPNEYAAQIPAQSFGTTVHYYIRAANTDGNTSYHPSGAPAVQHTFQVTADITPPVIVHVPLQSSVDLVGPYTIEATITDNVGVDPSGVTMTWRKNAGSTTTVTMTNVGGDVYQANISGPAVLGDMYEYYILARDVPAVPNTARDPHTGFHAFQIVDFYAWDFEAGNGGFTTVGPDWEWGDPTTGPMDAHSGVNVWATKLATTYSASSNSKLDLPPVLVPSSHPYATLSFWQWYAIEANYDGGNVKISTDGGATWTLLTPDIGYNGTARTTNAGIPGELCFTGTTTGNFWNKVSFDLTAYRGQTVVIRLHFGSDSSVQYPGWYVDDVRIESVDDTQGPVFVSTTPPASTFDTVGPYTTKTVVKDLFSGVSTVTLYYSTDNGGSWTTVAMTPTANPNEYSGSIPGQAMRTRIRLYVEATDNVLNTSRDPATAPAAWYEFGIMPSGDYLVLLGGASHTTPQLFIDAFNAIGKTADTWDVDDSGMPSLAILQAYQSVIFDHSSSFTAAQQTALAAYLDVAGPLKNRIFFLGRDLQYGSAARTFMEKYTGTVYVKDDAGFRRLRSMPGDPIGADESFVISGSYPDEVKLSTLYPGAAIVYRYSALNTSGIDYFDNVQDAREFFEKEGKEWDPKLWPFAPSGPDSAAAVRYVGTTHASVYFAFNFSYVQESARRAAVLDRVITWLDSNAAGTVALNQAAANDTPDLPDRLTLGQNYPNPFNPSTQIKIGVPEGVRGDVSLKIYNVRGQLVATLFEGTKAPGWYTFGWDGRNSTGGVVSTGVYFARFVNGKTALTRKMILLK